MKIIKTVFWQRILILMLLFSLSQIANAQNNDTLVKRDSIPANGLNNLSLNLDFNFHFDFSNIIKLESEEQQQKQLLNNQQEAITETSIGPKAIIAIILISLGLLYLFFKRMKTKGR